MKFAISLLICVGLPVFANQSVSTNTSCAPGANCPSVTLPNSAPFTTAGNNSQTWAVRIHAASFTTEHLVSVGPFDVLIGSGRFQITNNINPPVTDTLTASTDPSIPCCSGVTDVTIRLIRDVPNLVYIFQVCTTATSVCKTQRYPISILGTAINWNVFNVAFYSGFDVAWFRWFSGTQDPNSIILNTNTGNVLDWEFESTLVDSVIGLTFSNPVGVTYPTTPVFNPSCLPLLQQTFKVGVAGSATGTGLCQSLDGGAAPTPLWSYLGTGSDGKTQPSLVLGSPGAITTSVSGYSVSGSVNLNLHLTDGSGNTSDTPVHDGAVTVDANDVVTGLSAKVSSILGPLLRYGSPNNRQPWLDDRNKYILDLMNGAFSTNFPVYWNTPAMGTVSLSASATCGGSAAGKGVIGIGTHFMSDTSAGQYIVFYWHSNANRRMNNIVSVFSDTCLIIDEAWSTGTTETNVSYVLPNSTIVGNWAFGGNIPTPSNYYDSFVEANRSFYERSGIDTYWTAYATHADDWWAMPANDQGLSYRSGFGSGYQFGTRSQSLQGMFLRMLDVPAMETGIGYEIELAIGRLQFLIPSGAIPPWAINDQRDYAYNLLFPAECAVICTDATLISDSKAAIATYLPYYAAGISSDGSLPSGENGRVDQTHTANVQTGSLIVTCSGCDFTNAQTGISPANPYIAFYNGYPTYPATNADYRPTVYAPVSVSPTSLTLDQPYVEATNSAIGFATGAGGYGIIGWENQPFMIGIMIRALLKAAVATAVSSPTTSANAITYAQNMTTWAKTYGYADPAHSGLGGMYYFTTALTCAYPVQTTICTLGFGRSESRTDAAEVMLAIADAYTQSPNPTLLAFGNTLFDEMYGKPGTGGASTDGYYINQLDNGGDYDSTNAVANKWPGFFWGYSAGINWAAVSAGAGTPSTTVSRSSGLIRFSGPVREQ